MLLVSFFADFHIIQLPMKLQSLTNQPATTTAADALAMASESSQPLITDHRVRRILVTCLDGFSFSAAGQTEMQLVRGILRYNDFASRFFHREDESTAELKLRFKKNLCLFF